MYLTPEHEAVYAACKDILPELQAVIQAAIVGERERCAKICDLLGSCSVTTERDEGFNAACGLLASKIRKD